MGSPKDSSSPMILGSNFALSYTGKLPFMLARHDEVTTGFGAFHLELFRVRTAVLSRPSLSPRLWLSRVLELSKYHMSKISPFVASKTLLTPSKLDSIFERSTYGS